MRGLKAGCATALAVALLALSASSLAHGPPGSRVTAVLEAPDWPDITVQLRSTLAPQLLVANEGPQSLEVLDLAGRAFIRIGPQGVAGDMAAAAWYNSYSTARLTVPVEARDPQAPARWVSVRQASRWGWFDPRLDVAGVAVPDEIQAAGEPARFGAWSVPVRLDGQRTALHGHYRYTPPGSPAGEPVLLNAEAWPEGVALQLVPGPVPALLLDNRRAEPVTVLGLGGEPYLRIGPREVSANLASRTWREWGRAAADAPPLTGEAVIWQRIAGGARSTWLEPRALRPEGAPAGSWDWSITLWLGEKPFRVEGRTPE